MRTNRDEQTLQVPEQIRRSFERGHAVGLDPEASLDSELMHYAAGSPTPSSGGDTNGPESGAKRSLVTTLRSTWLYRVCGVCGHTFRLGNRVICSADGSTFHHMEELPCSGDPALTRVGQLACPEFYAGIEAAWPTPADLPLVRLEPGHPLLSRRTGFPRHGCRICGHSFRPYDHVISCSCTPHQPNCMVALHRDIYVNSIVGTCGSARDDPTSV